MAFLWFMATVTKMERQNEPQKQKKTNATGAAQGNG